MRVTFRPFTIRVVVDTDSRRPPLPYDDVEDEKVEKEEAAPLSKPFILGNIGGFGPKRDVPPNKLLPNIPCEEKKG